jgi:hypothetical protein
VFEGYRVPFQGMDTIDLDGAKFLKSLFLDYPRLELVTCL